MDDLDKRLLAELRQDGRAPISTLAATLGVTRATVRTRMERLQETGEIQGYRAILRSDVAGRPVRGIILIQIDGTGTRRISHSLTAMPEVEAVHSTHGRWDLVAELGAETLEALDETLNRIRQIDGISRSETNLFLSTRR
ncbi:AsnC family transcriptional regulator [Jannaschia pagri]|uniref:AsnC family transcriptional regulator n=1 Tax=Jannaschia pagri TaxID=2829797 RepID=A0ABQ4NQP7_9RHOB|nr:MULTISPECIES: Lrp/AsnC family transcriptional regulator [unclassified Jannaschia]GIT92571.1 AsnC family transcriptional regulator [Jannaschia sp. AI_61]GIT96569.1 AsnC family transcriptional regulator [Jannaschia sp. AI_62]